MSSEHQDVIAIGDIHGCSKTLQALLNRLDEGYGTTRTYVFLGDYVDRGPDSKGVVDILIEFSNSHNCVFLRGNHDAMLLMAYPSKHMLDWFDNGGDATMESYQKGDSSLEIPQNHLRFFTNTKLYHDASRWFFVHGGIPPNITIKEAVATRRLWNSFLWRRDHIEAEDNVWEKTVVFGHTPVRSPITGKNMVGIDTGCVYEHLGKLTAVLLPEMDFVQQTRIDF
ncbi:MAG: serine/threonine protein phosphatase [Balneolaceae bacterium]|nr:serine/threonine protein phosphatase [Balneolaceae bacterium]MBO6546394.1 serine/threonine protein phosphatase [Balneolaceae bacterium]MBO6648753.1 serine/threonine protein phosphatase [Balneolaceae bacterium]